jgi:hypothetical protein
MSEPRKRGGQRKSEEEKLKSSRFTIRIPTEMKARLQAIAQEKGRKLNAEVFNRLNRSLSSTSSTIMHDAFGGDRTFFLMMLLAQVVTSVEKVTQSGTPPEREKGKWLDDPFTFAKVRESLDEVLNQIAPTGEPVPPADMLMRPEYVGEANALAALDGLLLAADEPPRDHIDEDGVTHRYSDQLKRLPLIKAALGPDVISRIGRKS